MITGVVALQLSAGWVQISGSGALEAGPGRFFGEFILASVVFLSIGVYEEVLVRGYQMTNVAEGLRIRPLGGKGALAGALVVSSVAFGLLHAVNPGYSVLALVNITLIGVLVLGLAYALTGRLGFPIGLHTSWNFALSCVFGLPFSGVRTGEYPVLITSGAGPELWTGGAFGPEGGLLGTLAIVAGCIGLLIWVRLREGLIALQTDLARPPEGPES